LRRFLDPPDLIKVIEIPLERPAGFTFSNDIFEYSETPHHALKVFSLKTRAVETIDISASTKLDDHEIVQARTFESSPIVSRSGSWCLAESGEIIVQDPYLSESLVSKVPGLQHSRNIAVLDLDKKEVSVISVGAKLDSDRKYRSFLDKASCQYHVALLDAPAACARHERYLSCADIIQAVETPAYNGQEYYDSKSGVTYRYKGSLEEKDWPLEVTLFKGDIKLPNTVVLPRGSFVGGGERFACFSCGCACYRRLSVLHVNDNFYAIATGWSVENKKQGIYRLDSGRWHRIAKIGEYSHFLTASKNGCHVIWNEAKTRNPLPNDRLKWLYADMCTLK
jgi:hypothetical protein